MLKIAIYGHSGSGKSTTAGIMKGCLEKERKNVEILKLAYPLYYIQSIFYKTAGKEIEFYNQDQVLLEDIAGQLRKISPYALINDFNTRLNLLPAGTDVVINDDVREYDHDYPGLKKLGFIFFKVFCDEEIRIERLKKRGDISSTLISKTTGDIDKFTADYEIDTGRNSPAEVEKIIYAGLQKIGLNNDPYGKRNI
jgi:energy-coupling factor transporter ATP-binding protein EcfA2